MTHVEPASTYVDVLPDALKPSLCTHITTIARPMLERRGANRSDQCDLPRIDAAADLLGVGVVADVMQLMCDANSRWWQLDLDRWAFKILRYGPDHWAPPHIDMFPTSMCRKLTMVAQLNDPSAYAGGDLELQHMGDTWHQVPRGLGTCAVFPAWTRHHVTPITAGERWTLAAWGYGPPVR